MKKWGTILLCVSMLAACEKSITIETEQQTPKLVVEGQIEAGQTPIIVLSNSLNYFSTIDAATLNASYVHGAKVMITTQNKTFTLKETTVPLTGGYFFYYYTTTQSNPLTSLVGDNGKQYDLKIETGGQVYNATTTIPVHAKKIDSLWWKKAPNNEDTNKVVLMARITDPPGYGNYIRYFTRTGKDDFNPGLNSVFDDQIIDGKTYDIQVDRGVAKNDKLKFDDYGYFKKGDTATVKFCNIDKASFDFWRTWEFTYQSVGNPFSSPGKVISNISNGGLGSFCGYSVQYVSLIIPK
jgi:hypothetical protein